MRFGINTFLFTSPFTTKSTSLFPKFKKWGFDTVELPIEAPEHIDSVKVKKALDRDTYRLGNSFVFPPHVIDDIHVTKKP